LKLQLTHVVAGLLRQQSDGAVQLRPVMWNAMLELAAKDFHELRTSGGIKALKSQMVICGDVWLVQSLSHSHQNIRGQENMPVIWR